MNFAEWLREELHKRNMKQVDLANEFGVYASTVSVWLYGKTFPNEEQTRKLAAYFGVEESFLLRLMGKLSDGKSYSPQLAALLDDLDRMLDSIEDPEIRARADAELTEAVLKIRNSIEWLLDFKEKWSHGTKGEDASR